MSSDRRPTDSAGAARQTASSSPPHTAYPPSSLSSVHRRRSSVSVLGPDSRRQRPTFTRSVSSSVPSPAGTGAPVPGPHQHSIPDASVDAKARVSSNDVPSPAAIQAIFDVSQPGYTEFISVSGRLQSFRL